MRCSKYRHWTPETGWRALWDWLVNHWTGNLSCATCRRWETPPTHGECPGPDHPLGVWKG